MVAKGGGIDVRRVLWIAIAAAVLGCVEPPSQGPYQATGIKIGELTESSAIVWTRLTRSPERVTSVLIRPPVRYIHPDTGERVDPPEWPATPADWVPVVELPEGVGVEDLEGAAPGAPGEARVLYRRADTAAWRATDWLPVDPQRDFTRQFELTGLAPGTEYVLRVEARPPGAAVASASLEGRLRTAPRADEPARVVFGAVTGQDYIHKDRPDGYEIYATMLDHDLDFFVHTGDILYYDSWAKSLELARWGWAQMYSLPTNIEFQRRIPTYFMKDDHDTWLNDAWPAQQSRFMGEFTFALGQAVFLEQVPISGARTYRSFRWGRDLEIWLAEARDFRDPNPAPDGPGKTMWGAEQLAWFMQSAAASDATFRVLITPTPLTGPYTDPVEMDNHTNRAGFAHEGRRLRAFIAAQDNMIVICGDRHYQYVIEDPETGVREYATGPASDAHARGWRNDDLRPEHRYLNVVGGFLLTTVERRSGVPTMVLQHYSVAGELLNEDTLVAE